MMPLMMMVIMPMVLLMVLSMVLLMMLSMANKEGYFDFLLLGSPVMMIMMMTITIFVVVVERLYILCSNHQMVCD